MAWNNYGNPYMPNMMPYNAGMNYMDRVNQFSQMNPAQMQSQQMNTQIPMQQPSNGLIRVTGIDGAKAYQMPPNSVTALFDDTRDVFYVKSTDGAGFPTIKAFSFSAFQENVVPVPNANDFVTRQEFEELKGMIRNAEQFIPEQPISKQPASNAKRGNDKKSDATDAVV